MIASQLLYASRLPQELNRILKQTHDIMLIGMVDDVDESVDLKKKGHLSSVSRTVGKEG